MPNLTLLLLTHNEQDLISQNFGWLDKCPNITEIIAIDDLSTDATLSSLKNLSRKSRKVKTYSRGLNHNFSAQRQFGVSKSTNNWILWLDPDESPSPGFIEYIKTFNPGKYYNFAFKRHDIFLGHELNHGETASQYFLRLFHKKHGRFVGLVHEIWSSSQPALCLSAYLVHPSHSNLRSFFKKINFYSDLRAQELHHQGVSTNILQIITYPAAKFIQNYIFRLGFLDSTPGIILALGMSFHSFLVRSKLWHLSNS